MINPTSSQCLKKILFGNLKAKCKTIFFFIYFTQESKFKGKCKETMLKISFLFSQIYTAQLIKASFSFETFLCFTANTFTEYVEKN